MDTSHDQTQQFSKKSPHLAAVSVPSLLSLSLKDNHTNSQDLATKPPLQNIDIPLPSPSSLANESRNLHNHIQNHAVGMRTGSASPHRSPSLHGSVSGSLVSLQAVPEDAELGAVDSMPNVSASSFSSTSMRRLSNSSCSDTCSEDTVNSPILNISVQGHEISNSLLVALRHRAEEMRELYERNSPFFDQIASCVLSSTQNPSLPKATAEESPLAAFLDLLFAPREQVPDRVWMKSVEGYLSGAPALLETFRVLVGYEGDDNDVPVDVDDMGISGPWLPKCEDDEGSETEEDGNRSESPEDSQWKSGIVKEFIDIEGEPGYLKSFGIAI